MVSLPVKPLSRMFRITWMRFPAGGYGAYFLSIFSPCAHAVRTCMITAFVRTVKMCAQSILASHLLVPLGRTYTQLGGSTDENTGNAGGGRLARQRRAGRAYILRLNRGRGDPATQDWR